MKIGSLFSGYGGLDLGVQAVLGGAVAWHVELDPAPSRILAHRFPGVPNYGDITKVDWSSVEAVDVLTGGFPCQDLSLAGRRDGMRPGTRSGLWADYLKAIDALRPELAVIENVRGLLSGCAESEADSDRGPCPRCADPKSGTGHAPNVRALGRVLIDLASIRYDARWVGLRAADAGAPHERFRVFVVAHPDSRDLQRRRGSGVMGGKTRARSKSDEEWQRIWDTPTYNDPAASLTDAASGRRDWRTSTPIGNAVERNAATGHRGSSISWGPFEPAVRHWERTLGRPVPYPTAPTGRGEQQRHTAQFVEWMMGIPEGWVTDASIWSDMAPDRARRAQLKILGNGVVPQQASLAVATLLQASELAS